MKNKIAETQVDNITHMLAKILANHGVILGDELKCDLNDTLSAFLTEKCTVSITEDAHIENGDNIIQLAFDVISASVHQQALILNPEYNEESIIEGLTSGKLATTVGHDDEESYIEVVATGENIALILSQEVDGEYDDFR